MPTYIKIQIPKYRPWWRRRKVAETWKRTSQADPENPTSEESQSVSKYRFLFVSVELEVEVIVIQQEIDQREWVSTLAVETLDPLSRQSLTAFLSDGFLCSFLLWVWLLCYLNKPYSSTWPSLHYNLQWYVILYIHNYEMREHSSSVIVPFL